MDSQGPAFSLLALTRRLAQDFDGVHSGVYERTPDGWTLVLSPEGKPPLSPDDMQQMIDEWLTKKRKATQK